MASRTISQFCLTTDGPHATLGRVASGSPSTQPSPRLLAEQFQYALNNRVAIEQAKGVLAEYGQLTMDDAFRALRGYARNHHEPLAEVARAVAQRTLSCDVVIRGAIGRTHP